MKFLPLKTKRTSDPIIKPRSLGICSFRIIFQGRFFYGKREEEGAAALAAGIGGVGASRGGPLCARRPLWGMLPSAMLPAALFAVVLLGVGLLCWEGIAWTGRGGALLLCALAGGLRAALLSAAGKRRGKGRRRTRPL